MEEMKCTCGGTFQSLGPEHIRIGELQTTAVPSIPGELFACDRCRTLRFRANAIWLSERKAWWAERCTEVEQEQQLEQARFQARFQSFMQDFADYSEKKLEKIASGSPFSGYDEVAREAARQLLEDRKTNPCTAPREQEHVQPEPRPSWTRRKNSKPPWEG